MHGRSRRRFLIRGLLSEIFYLRSLQTGMEISIGSLVGLILTVMLTLEPLAACGKPQHTCLVS